MCKKRSTVNVLIRGRLVRVDPCLRGKIKQLNHEFGCETVACCCGHGVYRETILIKTSSGIYDHESGMIVPRVRRFYHKDENGFYFVPEVENEYNGGGVR